MVFRRDDSLSFLPETRNDPLGESWTHVDGAIGHFIVGNAGKSALRLSPGASHFVVLEAKIFSKLSPGVTHAKYFDQAARTVACIAEVLKQADLLAPQLSHLGFYVLAPRMQIEKGIFAKELDRESLKTKVEQRVREYKGDKDQWLSECFSPTLQHIKIDCLSWEALIEDIKSIDGSSGQQIGMFYDQCIKFNSPFAQ